MKQRKALHIFNICLIFFSVNALQPDTQVSLKVTKNSGISGISFSIRDFIMKNFGNTNEYFFEIIFAILAITYSINYLWGRSINLKYAQLWVNENKEFFQSNFSLVGTSNAPGSPLLEIEGAHSFKFYASGRPNCPYALVKIELKKRQNLISMVIFNLLWAEKDRVRIEIPITLSASLPFIFAVVKKKQAKFVHDNYPDINHFCQKMTCDELEGQYIVLGENEETSEFVLTDSVIELLKKYSNVIEMISFTDLKAPYKQFLRADLLVPSQLLKNPKDFQPIVKVLLYLVDHITRYKMSQSCRAKAEKERLNYENQKSKDQKKNKDNIKKETESKKKEEDQKRRKLQKKVV